MEARADAIRADAGLEAAGQRLARSHEVTIGTVEDMQAGTGLVLELDRLKRGAEKGRPTPNEAERMAAMRAQVETRSDALDETIRDAPEILREQLGLIDALGDGMRATRRAFEVGLATRAEPKEAEREHAVAVASVGLVVKGGSDSVRDVLRGPEGGGRGPGGTPCTPETALGGIARRGGEVAADTDEMRGRADGPNPRAPPEEGRRVTPSGPDPRRRTRAERCPPPERDGRDHGGCWKGHSICPQIEHGAAGRLPPEREIGGRMRTRSGEEPRPRSEDREREDQLEGGKAPAGDAGAHRAARSERQCRRRRGPLRAKHAIRRRRGLPHPRQGPDHADRGDERGRARAPCRPTTMWTSALGSPLRKSASFWTRSS